MITAPIFQEKQRFVFVDALRGVACVGVLFAHLLGDTIMSQPLGRTLPVWMQHACFAGSRGVQIFFVISGFVIAYSLRNFDPTARSIGRFVLRRQLRLDPPYWTAVALCLLIATAERQIPSLHRGPLPGPVNSFANLLYLQNVTGRFEILPVAWTLCIEIQFYAVFVAVLWVAKILSYWHGMTPRITAGLTLVLAAGSTAFSIRHPQSPWFLSYWTYFAGGAICCWTLARRLSFLWLAVPSVAWTAAAAFQADAPAGAGITTVASIAVVGIFGRLGTWSGGPVLQYLGRRSYSLYLVHVPVLSVALRGAYKLTQDNGPAAVAWFAVTPLLCLAAAEVMYRVVESPCQKLSTIAFKRRTPQSESTAVTRPAVAASAV